MAKISSINGESITLQAVIDENARLRNALQSWDVAGFYLINEVGAALVLLESIRYTMRLLPDDQTYTLYSDAVLKLAALVAAWREAKTVSEPQIRA